MSLGDLRKFLTSIESLPDEAPVKAKVGFGKVLRSLTVEDEDIGFRDYIRSVSSDSDDLDENAATADKSKRKTVTRSASD